MKNGKDSNIGMKCKVMTFNLRTAVITDGINYWDNRIDLVKQCITEEAPDLIGFQEVRREMLTDLRSLVGDRYAVLGCGRDKNFGGEGVNLAYRRDAFELISFETFWLSDTPGVPGSYYDHLDQSKCPRTTVIARLADKDGKVVTFCNTHLDHKGVLARIAGAEQIVQKLSVDASSSDALVITGDMNALPDTPEIAVFGNEKLGLFDLTKDVDNTFHNFGALLPENNGGADKSVKIDYIFANRTAKNEKAYTVKKYRLGNKFASDHYPVCAFIEY